jgi:hypothetical protein
MPPANGWLLKKSWHLQDFEGPGFLFSFWWETMVDDSKIKFLQSRSFHGFCYWHNLLSHPCAFLSICMLCSLSTYWTWIRLLNLFFWSFGFFSNKTRGSNTKHSYNVQHFLISVQHRLCKCLYIMSVSTNFLNFRLHSLLPVRHV